MRTQQSFDEKLARLRSVENAAISAEVLQILREALGGSQAVLAGVAAEIAGLRRIADMEPDIVAAFGRFMDHTDKGCQAKIAIAEALSRLECNADDVFLRGVRHVQMEPSFGKPVDTADNLRAECAMALARLQHPQSAFELTNLLVDPQINPRRAAIKSLAYLGGVEGELLLRLKSLVGDEEAEIMGECFNGLISMAPDKSLGFVAQFLDSKDMSVAEQAALALGQSHEAEAFEILRERWEANIHPEFRRMLLLPISLLRRDEAFSFLLDVVETGGAKLAAGAMTSLTLYADDESRRKIADIVRKRRDPLVSQAFEREFGAI